MPTPQQVAEATRDAMWRGDRASKSLGMEVLAIGPGTATLVMSVREDMLNGHDICHGGLIATLADSAFAYACNSYNEITVASGFSVDLLAPGRLGDQLTARCVEVSKSGRTGVYEILEMTRELVEAMNSSDPATFNEAGRRQMAGRTLRRDALRLASAGRTTIEEAMRVSAQVDE